MALNPALLSSDMLAIGSDSGVVNLYDDPAAITGSSLTRQQPTLRKAIMNLVSSSLLSLSPRVWYVHDALKIQLQQLYQHGPIVVLRLCGYYLTLTLT